MSFLRLRPCPDVGVGWLLLLLLLAGNYGGWKARAIGANNQAAQSILKSDYKESIELKEALVLAVKVLSKTMDTTAPTPDKREPASVPLESCTLCSLLGRSLTLGLRACCS